jgi:hypothetical protein
MSATREGWLEAMVAALTPLFAVAGYVVPPVRVSVGFPSRSALSVRRRALGQCWPGKRATDGRAQIFISPFLANSVEVLAVLVHELIHAVFPTEGHKGSFKRAALALGLRGPMRATTAGEDLMTRLQDLVERMGPYPHAELLASREGTQPTRLHKVVCPADGYTARITRKWLAVGLPTCPCGTRMREVLNEGDSDEKEVHAS